MGPNELNKNLKAFLKGKNESERNLTLNESLKNYKNEYSTMNKILVNYGSDDVLQIMFFVLGDYWNWFLNAQKQLCYSNKNGYPFINSRILVLNSPDEFMIVFDPPNIQILHETINTILYNLYMSKKLTRVEGDEGIYGRYKQRIKTNDVIFDHPENFNLFDNNLFFKHNYYQACLLHGKNFQEVLELKPQIKPTLKEFFAISRLIKKYNKSDSFLLGGIERKRRQICKGIIVLLKESYCEGSEKLIINEVKTSNPFKVKILKGNEYYDSRTSVLKEELEFLNNNVVGVPQAVLQYIDSLVDGNLELVDQLAQLVACTCLYKKKEARAWTVLTNNKEAVFNFFMNVFGEDNIWFTNSLKDLNDSKKIAELITAKYLDCPMISVMPNSVFKPMGEEIYKKFRKVLKCKPLNVSNSAMGKLIYVNQAEWFFFIENEKQFNEYRENIGDLMEVVKLPNVVKYTDELKFGKVEQLWIFIIFVSYGLTLLLKKKKAKLKVNSDYDRSKIVSDFIEKCCVVGPEYECYNSNLYEAFNKYFKVKYPLQMMSKITLRRILLAKEGFYENRPRHSRGDNKRGFKGFMIDEHKLNEYCSVVDIKAIKSELVKNYLESINMEMQKILRAKLNV